MIRLETFNSPGLNLQFVKLAERTQAVADHTLVIAEHTWAVAEHTWAVAEHKWAERN